MSLRCWFGTHMSVPLLLSCPPAKVCRPNPYGDMKNPLRHKFSWGIEAIHIARIQSSARPTIMMMISALKFMALKCLDSFAVGAD